MPEDDVILVPVLVDIRYQIIDGDGEKSILTTWCTGRDPEHAIERWRSQSPLFKSVDIVETKVIAGMGPKVMQSGAYFGPRIPGWAKKSMRLGPLLKMKDKKKE